MRSIIILCFLLTISSNIFSQVIPDSLVKAIKGIHHPEFENELVKINDITNSLSDKIKLTEIFALNGNSSDTCPEFGIYGNEYDRLLVKFIEIKSSEKNNLTASGRMDVQGGLYSFTGLINIEKILQYVPKDNTVEIFEFSGSFYFTSTSGMAKMEGAFKIITGVDIETKPINYKALLYEEGYLNAWVGKFTNLASGEIAAIAWGFERFPENMFPGFDLGGGEMAVNYKFVENGWSDTFSKQDYIRKQAENIPESDYNYYKVSSVDDIIKQWDSIEPLLGEQHMINIYDLNLGCK